MYFIGVFLSQVFYKISLIAMKDGRTNQYVKYMSWSNHFNSKYVLPVWDRAQAKRSEALKIFSYTNIDRTEPEF